MKPNARSWAISTARDRRPGSGKTYSIVLRALNLLLLGKAQPRQIVRCTFTEKAAFEMRDRLSAAAPFQVTPRALNTASAASA